MTCGIGIGLVIVSNLLFYYILGEVNAKSPPDQHVSTFWVNLKAFSIVRRHAELFPESRKRFQISFSFVLGLALMVTGLLVGIAHYSYLT